MDTSKEIKEFNCQDCKAKFKYFKSLKLHIKKKHQEKIIDDTTDNIKNVRKSLDISKAFDCNYCNSSFKYDLTLQNHIRKFHHDVDSEINIKNVQKSLDISKAFDCNYCNSSFKYDITLKKHIKKFHHDVYSEIFSNVCNVCSKKLSNASNLRTHVRTVHNYSNILYQCNICSKKYVNKYGLQKHQKKTHPDVYSKDQYQFFIKVENNTDKAENPKLIKCKVCERKYKSKGAVQKHMKTNHPEWIVPLSRTDTDKAENPKLIKCKVCEKKYKNKKIVQEHMKKIHPEWIAPLTRTIKCCVEDCNESFVYLHQYRKHLMDQQATGGHNYSIEKQELVFNNIGEFIQWKEDIEVAKDSRYVANSSVQKNKDGSYRRIYYCSRSGKYVCKGTGKRSNRTGTSKIGDYCPSTINIYCSSQGIVKCEYYETHFGHETSCENLMQISIHKRDRLFIAKKTLQGIEIDRILEELHKMGGRSARIKRNDIYNVVNSDILKEVARCTKSRNLNVDELKLNKYKVSSEDGVSHEVTFLKHCLCTKQCLLCSVCEHSYSCDCGAFSKINICKHVHAVGGVNIVQHEQMDIDDIYITEEVQMLNENFIPIKEEREEKIEKVNTILNQIKSSLDKCSVEGINKMIPLIEKMDTLRCTFERTGDS